MMVEAFVARPLSSLRRVIAARMTDAKITIPHYRLGLDLDLAALDEARIEANRAPSETHLSVNDCIVRACALALRENPAINVQLVDEEIRQFPQSDISIVVAIEGGLATPIVRAADRKSVWQIAREIQDFARRAAENQLKVHEINGGSFSISNLGSYGVIEFDAIINPPQCAILAVGHAQRRPIVGPDGAIGATSLCRVTLSLDHRAIDGAVGAAFLQSLKKVVEQPRELFETDTDPC